MQRCLIVFLVTMLPNLALAAPTTVADYITLLMRQAEAVIPNGSISEQRKVNIEVRQLDKRVTEKLPREGCFYASTVLSGYVASLGVKSISPNFLASSKENLLDAIRLCRADKIPYPF